MLRVNFYLLLVISFLLSSGGKITAETVDIDLLHDFVAIDSLDTVYFDIREAICNGPYIDIPLHIQSDDDVYSIDFAIKLNVIDLTYQSVQNYKSYLYESANFNAGDSTLRFTSFSLLPVENDSFIVGVRFNKSDGYINAVDFTNATAQLNGDFCSFKVIDTDPEPVFSSGAALTIQPGDSAHLIVSAVNGSTFLWSTGDISDNVFIDSAGVYQVTVTSPGSGCASVLSAAVSVAVPLPVEFGEIIASKVSSGVSVSWFTYSESMNDYFVIERSVNGLDWQDVGYTDGAGWSSQILKYSYLDQNTPSSDLYYRVRQTDFNGDFSWSSIAVAHFEPGGVFDDVLVFPNPCHQFTRVRFGKNSDLNRIRLLNQDGAVVLVKDLLPDDIRQGEVLIPLNLSDPGRMLLVELAGKSGAVYVPLIHLR